MGLETTDAAQADLCQCHNPHKLSSMLTDIAGRKELWMDGGNMNRDSIDDQIRSALLAALALVDPRPLLAAARDLASLGRVGALEQPVL